MPPAAKLGDLIEGESTLIVMVPAPDGAVPTPLPFVFNGPLEGGLSDNVLINDAPAATLDSTSENIPPYQAQPRPGPFQVPPSNTGTVIMGSPTVLINDKPAARMGDEALIAELDAEAPLGAITTGSPDVLIGE